MVIEVARNSLTYDSGEKADLYAAAGIKDYWVVDADARLVEIHRDPRDGKYRNLTIFTGQSPVCPLSFPKIALFPDTLWDG